MNNNNYKYVYYPYGYYYTEGGPIVSGPMPPAPSGAPVPPAPPAGGPLPPGPALGGIPAPGSIPPTPPPPSNPGLMPKPDTPPQTQEQNQNKAQLDILGQKTQNTGSNSSAPQGQQSAPSTPVNPPIPHAPSMPPAAPVAPVAPGMSESLLKYIPSKRQMRRMTREELLVLKKFLKSHVLKEAMENQGMENIQKFAKDSVSKVTNIPKLIGVFYPEFINDSLDATYNVILNSTDTKDSSIPTLINLKSTVQNSLDETMKLLNQSSDWISIILSKSLAELNASLSATKLGSLNVGKFFSISALAASVVYIMTKLFKSGFNNPETFSECVKLFKNLYLKKSKTFKEGIDEKLNEYMNKEVPSNVITLNSLITKAFPLAQGMLFNIGYDEGKLSNLPTNVLILTEVCCAIVIFYTELIGKKFKSMAEKGKMKAFISNNLLMKMDNAVKSPKDIFSNLNDFKKDNLDNAGDNNEGV